MANLWSCVVRVKTTSRTLRGDSTRTIRLCDWSLRLRQELAHSRDRSQAALIRFCTTAVYSLVIMNDSTGTEHITDVIDIDHDRLLVVRRDPTRRRTSASTIRSARSLQKPIRRRSADSRVNVQLQRQRRTLRRMCRGGDDHNAAFVHADVEVLCPTCKGARYSRTLWK
jgi:hypothetical protein